MPHYQDSNIEKTRYVPTKEEEKARSLIYEYLAKMQGLKNKPMPHFSGPEGDRSWLQMVDDSERVLNGYTLSREAQDKESWQSNALDNIARAKMRAVCAGVGLRTPGMDFVATNQEGVLSPYRAEIFKNITKHTFEDGNPTLHAYQEVWHMLAHGVIFEYEGFKTGGANREVVESFDTRTGEVTTKKEYVPGYGKPFSVVLNPTEFYWWDMFINNLQEQPRVAWVQSYTRAQCRQEFGKYSNYKFLRDKTAALKLPISQTGLAFDKWSSAVEDEDDFQVVRMYSKADNSDGHSPLYGYEVWVNGVPMLRCPLLWGKNEAVYPFAKQIAEPYANTNFFVGMPFGQLIEAYQDAKNTVLNTMIDKLYRSMEKPFLVGLPNMDVLDWEGKYVNQDNRFYVPDINQVKPFPYEGLNQGEFTMLQVLDRGIESVSVDRAQQGQAGGPAKTARETVIANQRAQELKGVLFLALEDLWYQKTKLRTEIILTHYLEDRAAQINVKDQIITVPDYTFGDGGRGVLAIHIAKSKGKVMSKLEVEARAQAMEAQGVAYKLISVPQDWLDEWQLDFKIVPQSLAQQDKVEKEEALMAEIQRLAQIDPGFVIANKERYVSEILALRGKHLADFNPPLKPAAPAAPSMPEPDMPKPAQPPPADTLLGLPTP